VTHLKVDPSVKEIEDDAFVNTSLVEVEFSEGQERIGAGTFLVCIDLKYINKLPLTLKEIGDGAFQDCEALVKVDFPEGLERIGSGAFTNCQKFRHINKLPSTLKEIGDHAFYRCDRLDAIEFPERLQVIGERALKECYELKRIKIPSAHVVIECAAFSHCYSLISVELPDGLQVIGAQWFEACTALTTVNVPLSVQEIQLRAFSECFSLASLALPEGLQSIGTESFQRCESLKSFHIPSTVCKMGTGVFRDCKWLRSVTLPEALDTIEEAVFCRCASLTHIRIPSSVTRIERAAFVHCTRLISLELPEGLEKIHLDGEYSGRDRGHPNMQGFRSLVNAIHLDDHSGNQEPPNIYGCQSLVNLVIPSEQDVEQLEDYDEFMDDLKLQHVASNYDDLVSKLQHRFDTLPVHRLCYYQSYYPLTATMENLRQAMDADPSAGTKVDSFRMTPFHILALSQTPNLSLFQELLKVCKVDIIRARDKFGSTPLNYLCLNHISEATTAIQTIIAQRIQWLGVAQWKSDISAAMDEALAVEWSLRRSYFGFLCFRLATYERLESLSLLELALWKVKIDGCKAAYDADHERDKESKRPRLDKSHLDGVDRGSCRINCGADVVMSNVLPFLDNVSRVDYYIAD
jgi:hypothetical protein